MHYNVDPMMTSHLITLFGGVPAVTLTCARSDNVSKAVPHYQPEYTSITKQLHFLKGFWKLTKTGDRSLINLGEWLPFFVNF